MYIVKLEFSSHRIRARDWMDEHNRWIQRGFDDGVFLLTGSLESNRGGVVLAANTTLEALQARIKDDPFVAHGVVEASVCAIAPSRAIPALADILGTNR